VKIEEVIRFRFYLGRARICRRRGESGRISNISRWKGGGGGEKKEVRYRRRRMTEAQTSGEKIIFSVSGGRHQKDLTNEENGDTRKGTRRVSRGRRVLDHHTAKSAKFYLSEGQRGRKRVPDRKKAIAGS